MNGLDLGLNHANIMRYLRDPSGVADLLIEANDETGDSPADIFADLMNVMRADTKMIARSFGVDLEIRLMTPERAAELLAGTIAGGGVDLVIMFNELAEQRDAVLREALTEAEYEAFMAQKYAFMNTYHDDDEEDDGEM